MLERRRGHSRAFAGRLGAKHVLQPPSQGSGLFAHLVRALRQLVLEMLQGETYTTGAGAIVPRKVEIVLEQRHFGQGVRLQKLRDAQSSTTHSFAHVLFALDFKSMKRRFTEVNTHVYNTYHTRFRRWWW